jgi:hypothetical protein
MLFKDVLPEMWCLQPEEVPAVERERLVAPQDADFGFCRPALEYTEY